MTDIMLRYISGDDVLELDALSVRVAESMDEQANTEVALDAGQWMPAGERLDPRLDVFEVVVDGFREASGRYADSQDQDGIVRLQVASWEEDARTAAPTSSTLAFLAARDDAIAREAVGRMPGIGEGSIEEVGGVMSVEFPRRSPAGMLRSLARTTGAFVRYTAQRTVEYGSELGRDRTGVASQVLEQGNVHVDGNVEGLQVRRDTRVEPTHILVLGAGEGASQVAGVAVSPRFTGGRQVWRRFTDSQIQTTSQARTQAATLVAELESVPASLFVRATGVDVGPRPGLGDRFQVRDIEQGLDAALRVLSRVWRIDGGGEDTELVLSNRRSLRV